MTFEMLIGTCMVLLTAAILVGVGVLILQLRRESRVEELEAEIARRNVCDLEANERFRAEQTCLYEAIALLDPLFLRFDAWGGSMNCRGLLERCRKVAEPLRLMVEEYAGLVEHADAVRYALVVGDLGTWKHRTKVTVAEINRLRAIEKALERGSMDPLTPRENRLVANGRLMGFKGAKATLDRADEHIASALLDQSVEDAERALEEART